MMVDTILLEWFIVENNLGNQINLHLTLILKKIQGSFHQKRGLFQGSFQKRDGYWLGNNHP